MSEPASHIDELTLIRYLDGALSEHRVERVRRHVVECAPCRASYEGLRAETELIRAALSEHDEALPEQVRPRSEDVSWVLVALLALGTLAISSLWTRFVTPALEGLSVIGVEATDVAATLLIQSFLWGGWSEMIRNVIEGSLSLAAVGFASFAAHRAWRWARSGAAVLGVFGLALIGFGASSAEAAVIELDAGAYTLPEGERVDNDLVIAGRRIVIAGVIDGDLIVAAGNVEISGEVTGDLLGFAEAITITGRLGGSLRAASRSHDIQGVVGRNVTVGGETVHVRAGATVGGSVIAGAREVVLEGPVERDLLLGAELTEINGRVGGSSLIGGNRLRIGPEARVSGSVRYYGPEEPSVDGGAQLSSPVEFERVEEETPDTWIGRLSERVFFWGAAFVFGAAFLLLGPGASEAIVAEHVGNYGKSLLSGVVAVLALLTAAALVAMTVIGLPLSLLAMSVLFFGLYLAQTLVGSFIGREILGAPASGGQALGRLALGLLLIHVLKALPFVSWLVTLLVALWGFGALASWLRPRLGVSPRAEPVGDTI